MAFPSSIIGFGATGFANTNALGNSTLNIGISSGTTSIDVVNATVVTTWPTSNFAIRIDDELIFINSRTSNTLTVGTRGFNSTLAAAHLAGATVVVVFTSLNLQAIHTEIVAIETELGINGANYVKTASNLGAGEEVFSAKNGTDLEFKTLVAGDNITLTADANTITIDASGSGSSSSWFLQANGGTTTEIEDAETVNFAPAPGSSITVSRTDNTIYIGGSGSGDNLGNHIAQNDLNMSTKNIVNINNISRQSGQYIAFSSTSAKTIDIAAGGAVLGINQSTGGFLNHHFHASSLQTNDGTNGLFKDAGENSRGYLFLAPGTTNQADGIGVTNSIILFNKNGELWVKRGNGSFVQLTP